MKYLSIFIIVFLFSFSCNKRNEIDVKNIDLPEKGDKIVESVNTFGLNVFSEIVETENPETNIIISPLSLNIALSMVYNGADGQTSEEMKNVLEYQNLTIDEINDCYYLLIDQLQSVDRKVELSIANLLMIDENFYVSSDFFKTLHKKYYAEAENADFSDPETVDDINKWVDKQTKGKIEYIIKKFSANEVLAILNAIYFKGKWHYDFDKNNTSPQDFMLPDSSIIQVETMTQEKSLKTGYSEYFTAVELPYSQGNFVMDLFIPNEGYSIDKVLDTLQNFNQIVNDFTEQEIQLYLPKFDFEYEINFNDLLKSMGMENAFTDSADFSKISEGLLFITRVLQKSYIKLDEKGTEAASITFIGMGKTAVPFNVVKFNRPFIYIIREVSTNTIIFAGRVSKPE